MIIECVMQACCVIGRDSTLGFHCVGRIVNRISDICHRETI